MQNAKEARPSSVGKRTLEEYGEPPGLGKSGENKVRRVQNVYALDIQTHVEVLQQVIQRFDVQITNGSTQEVREWVAEIWSVLGEVANHLHSVSHFASQGFEQQGLHCQSMQYSVESLAYDLNRCVSDMERVSKTEENLQKQYEQISILRGKLDKVQMSMSRVLSLLDGVHTPLTEAFSGIYHEKVRIDNLIPRVEQLETLGVQASEHDMRLDGTP
eukprot:3332751-Amphidinium_carterae.1